GLDQGLEHQLDALADHVDVPAGADRVEQAGHVKLGEGHRETPSALFGRKAEDLPVAPPQWWMLPASTPLGGTSTTRSARRSRSLRFRTWLRFLRGVCEKTLCDYLGTVDDCCGEARYPSRS